MEIDIWIQDCHGGGLEEEDQLYTNQMSHSEVLKDPAKDGHEAADTTEPLNMFDYSRLIFTLRGPHLI